MKRSFYAAIENATQAVTNFFGIGPTTAQAQQASNTQPEQAQNQLAKSSLPFTLTEKDLLDSLNHHGYFCIPFELTTRIIQSFPSIEALGLRTVSKPFCLAWEKAAKNLLFISKPTIYHLGPEQVCNILHEQQQAEIKYLIKNKELILIGNYYSPRLINIFAKLISLENNASLMAYHAKEKCLNILNETIIRSKIAKTLRSIKPTELYIIESHLTRLPPSIFSDPTLCAFWRRITQLYLDYNQLTSLPDAITSGA